MADGISRRTLLKSAAVAAVPVADLTAVTRMAGSDDMAVLGLRARRYRGESLVTGHVRISGRWTVKRLTITAGATLEFDPDTTTVLRSRGNVVVRGTLRMRPSSEAVTHRVKFVDIDEGRFVGGGMQVRASDVGLWVVGSGRLDARGTPKAGWNRAGTDPSWQRSDDIRLAPHTAGDFTEFRRYELGEPVPRCASGDRSFATEVFNLTRNVIIGGSRTGRAHVMFLHSRRQHISHVRIEHVGPRQRERGSRKTIPVPGRYGLHFHHCGNRSRGTVVEGVVVAHSGNRAFVPHASHGITMRDCVAFDVNQHAFWWDPDDKTTGGMNATHDVLYDHCAAFKISPQRKADRGPAEYRLSGFHLGQGRRNRAVDCAVAGVYTDGGVQTSGFFWPSSANQKPNLWALDDCVAHNNEMLGFFAWQNDPRRQHPHRPRRLTAYLNGEAGISHGAYINDYRYAGAVLVANGTRGRRKSGQLVLHTGRDNQFSDFVLDAAGRTEAALLIMGHKAPARDHPTRCTNLSLSGHARWPIIVDSAARPGWFDFVGCTVDGQRDLEPADFHVERMPAEEKIRVLRRDGTAWQLRPDGSAVSIPRFG